MEDPEKKSPPRKLVLHFDVNETIMVGDPAGGDSFEDCLNKMICKSAFVRPKYSSSKGMATLGLEDFEWHDGTPLDSHKPPPLVTTFEWPPDCLPAYKVPCLKTFAKTFTVAPSPGVAYRALYDQLGDALRTVARPQPRPPGGDQDEDLISAAAIDPRLTHKNDPGYFLLLPAFLHTLQVLVESGREFAVVVRTFGSDGPDIAHAVAAWAEGCHPSFPGCAPGSAMREYFSPPPGSEIWLEGRVQVSTTSPPPPKLETQSTAVIQHSDNAIAAVASTASAAPITYSAPAPAATSADDDDCVGSGAHENAERGVFVATVDPRKTTTSTMTTSSTNSRNFNGERIGSRKGKGASAGKRPKGNDDDDATSEEAPRATTDADLREGGDIEEARLARLFNASACMPVLRDDYDWWQRNAYQPWAGKPLWFDANDQRHHPIFFDDNIHDDAHDSIVAVRARLSPNDEQFTSLSGEATRRLQGTLLVRVPTVEPLLDLHWFLHRIADCEEHFATAAPSIKSLSA